MTTYQIVALVLSSGYPVGTKNINKTTRNAGENTLNDDRRRIYVACSGLRRVAFDGILEFLTKIWLKEVQNHKHHQATLQG